MSITLTTTPLSTEDILVEWAYSTFDEATNVEISSDGISYAPISGSPFALGVGSAVASGLTDATKYYFRIKKTVWVGYTKSNGDSDTLLSFQEAFNFDGVNDYSIANAMTSLPFETFQSGSFWIKFNHAPPQVNTAAWIFLEYDGGGGNGSVFGMIETQQILPTYRRLFLTIYDVVGSTGNLNSVLDIPETQNEWFSITWALIKGVGANEFTLKTSVNGVLSVTGNDQGTLINNHQVNFGQTTIASVGGDKAEFTIDQFAIVKDKDLTDDRVAIYNGGEGTDVYQMYDPSDFVLYYDFNEGTANGDNSATGVLVSPPELIDRSPNGYDGTLQNTAKTGTVSNWVDSIDTALDVFTVTPLSTTSITFTVDANPSSLDVEFEYSDQADFSVIDGSGSTTTSVAVTGLDPNTLYYFRAKNTGMTGYFKIESATTL